MTEEEKKIKKWSNKEKVEALARFVALRSGDPRQALLYGFILDCLLDEINKREKKIQKQQKEIEKKDKIIGLMAEEIDECGECPHEIYEEDFDCKHCEEYSSIDCWKKFFERKVQEAK